MFTSDLCAHLTPEGKIYLPHVQFVRNNLGSEIKTLHDIRSVTDETENPIMRATFACEELGNVRKEYLRDSEIDGIRGYSFVLTKKSFNEIDNDDKDPLENTTSTSEQVLHAAFYCSQLNLSIQIIF